MTPVDRVRFTRTPNPSAVRLMDCAGAPLDGLTLICPAGTTVERVQGFVVLRFMDEPEPVVFGEDMVAEVR